jgi:hypothetical protein
MIPGGTMRVVQLRLDLAECPAPAAALWELVGDEERQTAMTLLAALIAQGVVGESAGDGHHAVAFDEETSKVNVDG